jgi:hypothetical protein
MKATQRIFRTADGVIVAEGDPRGRFLVAGIGDEVDDEWAAAAKEFLGDATALASPDDRFVAEKTEQGDEDAPAEKASGVTVTKKEPKSRTRTLGKP